MAFTTTAAAAASATAAEDIAPPSLDIGLMCCAMKNNNGFPPFLSGSRRTLVRSCPRAFGFPAHWLSFWSSTGGRWFSASGVRPNRPYRPAATRGLHVVSSPRVRSKIVVMPPGPLFPIIDYPKTRPYGPPLCRSGGSLAEGAARRRSCRRTGVFRLYGVRPLLIVAGRCRGLPVSRPWHRLRARGSPYPRHTPPQSFPMLSPPGRDPPQFLYAVFRGGCLNFY